MGLTLGIALKFYTSVTKRLKLKVRTFWRLIPTFAEVAGEKLVGETFLPPFILNRVKIGNQELIGIILDERQTFQDHREYLLLKQIKQIDYYEGILLQMST